MRLHLVGQRSQGVEQVRGDSAFRANLARFDLLDSVEILRARSTEVRWDRRIGLLFIDGLHDGSQVRADFEHFPSWLLPGQLWRSTTTRQISRAWSTSSTRCAL